MIGTVLGPYRVVSELGAGGMGEVYRARDTKLDRDVALKILPESVASDPDRLMRFEREAKTLASLNHPNIAAIYGLESPSTGSGQTGTNALVMELVEGEDLSARIARGALPLDDVLPIARQIADALEAAHEAGIIHRDLKPANIKVKDDGTVKVLDFGLAKAIAGPEGQAPHGDGGPDLQVRANSPTMTSPAMTAMGMILGTAAYMSPEQAKGRPVDRRTDVWAFGVILHEMLTGQSLFGEQTVSESIAAVLTREPDWSRVPAPVRRLLRACLQKDPRTRLRSAGDAFLLLEADADTPSPSRRPSLVPWIVGALALGAAAATLMTRGGESASPASPLAFTERAPEGTRFGRPPQVSPDGQYLALLTRGSDAQTQVWIRALDEAGPSPLGGTEGARLVVWSPDSANLAFAVGDDLLRVSRGGGRPQRVATVPVADAVWTPEDGIVVVGDSGIFQVPATGGTPQRLLADREGAYADLALMPSGHHVLLRQFGGETGLYVLDLRTADLRPLEWGAGATMASGIISFASPDIVLYQQEQDLVGRHIDIASLTMVGSEFPVTPATGNFAGSHAGSISYLPRVAVKGRLTWRDRDGALVDTVGDEADYRELRLSRSGERLVFAAADPGTGNLDLWVQDLAASAPNRLTTDPGVDHLAVFSPDGGEVVWEGHRGTELTVFRRPSDVADGARLVRQWNRGGGPTDWSPDGSFVLYQSLEVATQNDLWVIPMLEETEPFSLIATEFADRDGKISPDGDWLAYVSTASGQEEIYLQQLDGWMLVGGPQRVSSAGGFQPQWRGDGSELFYLNTEAVWVVETDLDAARPAGTPRALFPITSRRVTGTNEYAVSPDGQRVLMIEGDREPRDTAVVILNWANGLTRR